jgi:aminoglycoside phosphotransferase (APT) family kinase protein
LELWLGERLASSGRVSIASLVPPASNGASSETYLFDAEVKQDGAVRRQLFVARFEPEGPGVYPEYDIAHQYAALKALRDHTRLPVATVRWLETDRRVAGAPFYVMDGLEGRAPTDFPPIHVGGWVYEAPPWEQRRLWFAGIEAMAQVHAVNWRTDGLQLFNHPQFGEPGLPQQLGYCRHFYRWASQGDRYDIIENALQWLDAHAPFDSVVHLLWGDSRFGNVFFCKDGRLKLLDWEIAWLGDPATDCAWWLAADHSSSGGVGVPRLPGLPSYEETIAHYERVAGRKLKNLGYYLILATTLGAITMIRIGHLLHGASEMGRKLSRDNMISQSLETLLAANGEMRTPAE